MILREGLTMQLAGSETKHKFKIICSEGEKEKERKRDSSWVELMR